MLNLWKWSVTIVVIVSALLVTVRCANADSLTKEYPHKIKLAKEPSVYAFGLQDVRLLEGPFKKAMDRNAIWLKSLESDRLLARFRKEAGLEPKGEIYGGWEKGKGSGHSLGHYLSACSMQYAATGDEEFKKRVDYIVDELALCQEAHKDGYLSAIPNGHQEFTDIGKGDIRPKGSGLNALWVPWYVQHKIYAGLRDAYVYAHNEKALTLLTKLSDWAIETTRYFNEQQWQTMLSVEHGGMMEVLTDVYDLTSKPQYLDIAEKFYHKVIMDPLSQKQDSLVGLHANTQIPKIIGAARLYELTGDEKFKTISEYFWKTVANHYSFVNKGNSACEHFGQPDQISEPLHDTTETCNTYNMLKLTRYLFSWDPKQTYMDYYEQAMWNHILASQNFETGMVMYKGFLDMPTRKKYSLPYDSFWCCVGTGFENHTKYGECIWAYKNDTLYLNQFIASQLDWKDRSLKVRLDTDFPQSDIIKLSFTGEKTAICQLKIRKPGWANDATCTINGKSQELVYDKTGYLVFKQISGGDVIVLRMPMKVHVETMPDKSDRIAFLYGPIVLAADLSGGTSLPTLDGQGPSLLSDDLNVGDSLPMLQGIPQELVAKIKPIPGKSMEYIGEKISKGIEENSKAENVRLIPLYQIVNEKYTVYMDTYTDQSRKVLLQVQRDLNVTGKNMTTGQHSGRNWRQANDGGWFAFDLKVPSEGSMNLVLTYWCINNQGRDFDILIDDVKIAEETMKKVVYRPFTDITYAIPEELTQGKEKVRVKLAAKPGKIAGRLYDAKIVEK